MADATFHDITCHEVVFSSATGSLTFHELTGTGVALIRAYPPTGYVCVQRIRPPPI